MTDRCDVCVCFAKKAQKQVLELRWAWTYLGTQAGAVKVVHRPYVFPTCWDSLRYFVGVTLHNSCPCAYCSRCYCEAVGPWLTYFRVKCCWFILWILISCRHHNMNVYRCFKLQHKPFSLSLPLSVSVMLLDYSCTFLTDLWTPNAPDVSIYPPATVVFALIAISVFHIVSLVSTSHRHNL